MIHVRVMIGLKHMNLVILAMMGFKLYVVFFTFKKIGNHFFYVVERLIILNKVNHTVVLKSIGIYLQFMNQKI
jgi:hypothetical protein